MITEKNKQPLKKGHRGGGLVQKMTTFQIKNRKRIDNLDKFYLATGCSHIGFLTL